ncbi:MAG: helix-turn-helix domain-containing protein [Blastocatellia bacterium]
MITVREFAELIRRPYHTVRRWVSSGRVPGVEPIIIEGRGPVYHVPRSAVAQFKKQQPRRGRPPKKAG